MVIFELKPCDRAADEQKFNILLKFSAIKGNEEKN